MAVSTETPSALAAKSVAKAADGMLLVDLGKKSRKQVRQLRKGEGKLVAEVQRALHDLRSSGTADSSQPVVVVVREKRPRYEWY